MLAIILAVLGLTVHDAFFCFHLLRIVVPHNRTLKQARTTINFLISTNSLIWMNAPQHHGCSIDLPWVSVSGPPRRHHQRRPAPRRQRRDVYPHLLLRRVGLLLFPLRRMEGWRVLLKPLHVLRQLAVEALRGSPQRPHRKC